jgi:hypothetical protein
LALGELELAGGAVFYFFDYLFLLFFDFFMFKVLAERFALLVVGQIFLGDFYLQRHLFLRHNFRFSLHNPIAVPFRLSPRIRPLRVPRRRFTHRSLTFWLLNRRQVGWRLDTFSMGVACPL